MWHGVYDMLESLSLYLSRHNPKLSMTKLCLIDVGAVNLVKSATYPIYAEWGLNLSCVGVCGSYVSVLWTGLVSPVHDGIYNMLLEKTSTNEKYDQQKAV